MELSSDEVVVDAAATPRRYVFCDGVSCLGKTASCDVSCDLIELSKNSPLIARPNASAISQCTFVWKILDAARSVRHMTGEVVRLDRHPLCTLAYAALGECGGFTSRHEDFLSKWTKFLADHSREFGMALATCCRVTAELMCFDKAEIEVILYAPADGFLETVAAAMKRRAFFDCDWGVDYLRNQRVVFRAIPDLVKKVQLEQWLVPRYVEVETWVSLLKDN